MAQVVEEMQPVTLQTIGPKGATALAELNSDGSVVAKGHKDFGGDS